MTHEAILDAAQAPRKGAELPLDRVQPWLASVGLPGDVEVLQFPRGWSNLTYLLKVGGRDVVLRRPPPGVAIATAHDMKREHRILSALSSVWDKAPRPIALCEDPAVLGAPFYVMERAEGVILRAKWPAQLVLDPARMKHLSEVLLDTLAEIHAVDVSHGELATLGKPEGYNARQVKGWTERYDKSKTDEIESVEPLASWLAKNTPKESGAALIHNDLKYDNVVLSPDLSRAVAVLDWEMATVGDPLMDLGCTLGYWVEADDPPLMQAMRFGPTYLPGSLRRMDLVRRYEERTGRAVTNLTFYFAFSLFKLAVVAQQLYARFVRGQTTEPRYAMMIEGVRGLTRAAVKVIDADRIDVIATD
jgi:aminoglycoside phosphotransferase (APT) family kinase protein